MTTKQFNDLGGSGSGSAPEAEALAKEVAHLKFRLRDIDCVVQAEAAAVGAILQMALLWLKSPVESHTHYDVVYQSLIAIRGRVCDVANSVECVVEELGIEAARHDHILNDIQKAGTAS